MQLAIKRRKRAKVLVKQGSVVCHHTNEADETSILTRSTRALFWISISESNEDWRHNRQTKQNTFLKEIFIPLQLKVRSWYQRVPAAVFLEVRVWHARVWPPKKVRYPFRLGPFSVEFPRQTGRVVSVWWLKKMTLKWNKTVNEQSLKAFKVQFSVNKFRLKKVLTIKVKRLHFGFREHGKELQNERVR